jgi:hypothetical protein
MAQADEIAKRDQQIADLQAQMRQLIEATEKRGPGRPKKEAKTA